MSTLRRRLADIEEQKAFRDWQESEREFKGRPHDELKFFATHGYFPEESLEAQLPQRQEFTVGAIRTVITAEWAGD